MSPSRSFTESNGEDLKQQESNSRTGTSSATAIFSISSRPNISIPRLCFPKSRLSLVPLSCLRNMGE